MMFGKRKEAEVESVQRQRIITFKRVFGSPEGKEVLFELMNRFHILSSHGGDPLKEGQRSVVLEILSLANMNLAQFDQMLKGESGE